MPRSVGRFFVYSEQSGHFQGVLVQYSTFIREFMYHAVGYLGSYTRFYTHDSFLRDRIFYSFKKIVSLSNGIQKNKTPVLCQTDEQKSILHKKGKDEQAISGGADGGYHSYLCGSRGFFVET